METGWWDDEGRPAPWPADFHRPDSGWTSSTSHTLDEPNETQPF